MRSRVVSTAGVAIAVVLGGAFMDSGPAKAQSAQSLLNERCSGCHEGSAEGGLSRISRIRKTPEGWDMNLARMTVVHGVQLTGAERSALVKYLADTQGLAPSETTKYRYILERRPDAIDDVPNEDLGTMCGRCHSFARVGLQRRDEDEWLKHSHFHLGQFPTAEYQALGRDRDWFGIATTTVPKELGEMFPFESAAWDAWKGRSSPDLSGTWRIAGNMVGKGQYEGSQTVTKTGDDTYSVSLSLRYADGTRRSGKGNVILYTGYEWRASLSLGGQDILQVMAVSEDGNEISGRWFHEDADLRGGDQRAVRKGGGAQVLAVAPGHMKKLHNTILTISGKGLSGDVDLGDNIRIVKFFEQSADRVIVEVMATWSAKDGPRGVSVGSASAADSLVIYGNVDSLRVEPGETFARVGGGGGPIAPVPAQFEAVGYLNGPDGEAGTDDDVRIGALPASWRHENFDEAAAALEDAKFVGSFGPNGLFQPAVAGPNPQRVYGTNNVGNVNVVATVKDGDRELEGKGHLFVTVQRFIDPPIR